MRWEFQRKQKSRTQLRTVFRREEERGVAGKEERGGQKKIEFIAGSTQDGEKNREGKARGGSLPALIFPSPRPTETEPAQESQHS
jgi:hypothetical protein